MGLDALLSAVIELVGGGSFLYLLAGVMLGLCFGVIPGLGGTTALALLIPVTYGMSSLDAMYLAGGVMGAVAAGQEADVILHQSRAGTVVVELSAAQIEQRRMSHGEHRDRVDAVTKGVINVQVFERRSHRVHVLHDAIGTGRQMSHIHDRVG